MLTKKTVLVLGAGASVPYGFPTGGQLLDIAMSSQSEEWWALAEQVGSWDNGDHLQFKKCLHESGSPSIDHFVGRRPEFNGYAKALIAYHIGRAEKQSKVVEAKPDADWHKFFCQLLVDGADSLDALKATQLQVITFNFDRSFLEGLLIRLSNTFNVHRTIVAKAISHWQVLHVHGSLGSLPEFPSGTGHTRRYGDHISTEFIRRSQEGIKFLNEAEPDSLEFSSARSFIQNCEVAIFLGFGFHRMNCDRLIPDTWLEGNPEVHATVIGLSQGAVQKATRRITPPRHFHTENTDALAMLRKIEDIFSD